jgi:hypothetical protein
LNNRILDDPHFTRSCGIKHLFMESPHLIENMVARDVVEPPTPAFSGPKINSDYNYLEVPPRYKSLEITRGKANCR